MGQQPKALFSFLFFFGPSPFLFFFFFSHHSLFFLLEQLASFFFFCFISAAIGREMRARGSSFMATTARAWGRFFHGVVVLIAAARKVHGIDDKGAAMDDGRFMAALRIQARLHGEAAVMTTVAGDRSRCGGDGSGDRNLGWVFSFFSSSFSSLFLFLLCRRWLVGVGSLGAGAAMQFGNGDSSG
jgi:hypothetical protein